MRALTAPTESRKGEEPEAGTESISQSILENLETEFPNIFSQHSLGTINDVLQVYDPRLHHEFLREPTRFARLAILEIVRQCGASFGFSEDAPPCYEVMGDHTSDVLFRWDTYNLGHWNVRIPGSDLRIQVMIPAPDMECLAEVERMQRFLHTRGLRIKLAVIETDGTPVEIPDPPRSPKPVRPTRRVARKYPLDHQQLTFDAASGRWFGSRRKYKQS